ncbi:MAG TPA: hypothetical protein VJ793_12770 [Anaerolineae bacterium]|nr:hypothetical protein [Anaerolineae bacterium]
MASTSAQSAVDMAGLKQRRNKKVSVVARPARPAWIVDVKEIPESSTILFDLVFRPNPHGGWHRRRYEYDGESDVLYHRGEQAFPESEVRSLPDEAEFKG